MCHTEKALKSSPLLSLLGDTSMVLELLTGGTRFPKEQQEMLQSSCPPAFFLHPPSPRNLYEPPVWSKLPEFVRRHVDLGLPVYGNLEVPPLRWKKQQELL